MWSRGEAEGLETPLEASYAKKWQLQRYPLLWGKLDTLGHIRAPGESERKSARGEKLRKKVLRRVLYVLFLIVVCEEASLPVLLPPFLLHALLRLHLLSCRVYLTVQLTARQREERRKRRSLTGDS